MDRMRKGMSDGLMPPRFLLEKVVTQAEGIAASKAEDSPFGRPLAKMPAAFSEADRARVREELLGGDQRLRAPGLREVREVREGDVRAEGADRARDVVPPRRGGPLRFAR